MRRKRDEGCFVTLRYATLLLCESMEAKFAYAASGPASD